MEAFSKWNASTQMLFSCIVIVAGFVLTILGCIFVHSLLRLLTDSVTALFWGWPVVETPPAVEDEEEDELVAAVNKNTEMLAVFVADHKKWLETPDDLVPLVEETNRMLTLIVTPPQLFTGTSADLDALRKNWEALNTEYRGMKRGWDARNAAVATMEPLDYEVERKLMREEQAKLQEKMTVEKEIELTMDMKDK